MPAAVDIDTFLDGLKFNRVHLRIVIIATLIMMIDGFDLQVLAWVLPKVAEGFGVKSAALTPALMSQQVGMLMGAFLVTPLGDRIGRRGLLLVCIASVVISSFATIFANSIAMLTVCRLVTGIFASAMVSTLVSLTAEAAPRRIRNTLVTIVLAGSMPGAILGSLMQAFLLEEMNWQGAFWIATALPLIMLPFAYFGLPESLRFLAAKDTGGAKTAALVRKLQPADAEPVTIAAPAPSEKGKAPRAWPFGGGMTVTTLLLWLAFMCSFTYISGASWKTTVFRDVIGLPWAQVAATTALGTAGGAVGMLLIGVCIDRFGFRAVVPAFYFVAATATVVIGLTAPTMTMYVALAIMGAFQHGAHAGLVSLASAIYPTSSRATGVGWAYGAGRGASVFGPLLIAGALHRDLGVVAIFLILAAPLALTGACVFFLASRPLAAPAQGHAH